MLVTVLISLLSQLCLSSGLCPGIPVMPYLQSVFPVVMFIALGAWAKTITVGTFQHWIMI